MSDPVLNFRGSQDGRIKEILRTVGAQRTRGIGTMQSGMHDLGKASCRQVFQVIEGSLEIDGMEIMPGDRYTFESQADIKITANVITDFIRHYYELDSSGKPILR